MDQQQQYVGVLLAVQNLKPHFRLAESESVPSQDPLVCLVHMDV